MKKGFIKIILLLTLFFLMKNSSFADFSLYLDSDKWDYIWKSEMQIFSDSKNDHLTAKKSYDNDSDYWYQFILESFSLWSDLWLEFEPEWGEFKEWMYYPAKRFPFNGSYNGIDISGDGRWCNKILWWFYIHEFVLSADKKTVKKAAIDFVQYCEEGTAWLYGSLRYNSSISNSCDSSWCNNVRKMFWLNSIEDSVWTDSNNEYTTNYEEDDELLKKSMKFNERMFEKYPLLYTQCFFDEKSMDEFFNNVETYENMINVNSCKWKYLKELKIANKVIKKIWEMIDKSITGTNTENNDEQIKEIANRYIVLINNLREKLKTQDKLTYSLDITLSATWFILELVIWGIEELQ